MAERFFDTSATVKHYLPETGTAKVDTLLAEAKDGDASACEAGLQLCGDLYMYWHIRGKNLTARDFEVLENGHPRSISDFRRDTAGVSIALLFDVSGSMEGHLPNARESAAHALSWLEPHDEAAVFTFDTRLDEAVPFTAGLKALPESMTSIVPFGATATRRGLLSCPEPEPISPKLRRNLPAASKTWDA